MTTIYNSDLTKELVGAAGIQTSRDKVPNQIAEKVVPVMEVNPKLLRRANIVRQTVASNTTAATIYTTPSDRDFYLASAFLGVIKDATSTSVATSLRVIIDGATYQVLAISGFTLTAQSEVMTLNFHTPIKVDRNTAITVNNSTNVANISANAGISGYIVDTSNA